MIQEVIEQIVDTIVQAILAILSLAIPFIVGDSTTVIATEEAGYGSGWGGHGYAQGYRPEWINPLEAPPESYEGYVVLTVSVWDHSVDIDELVAYRNAVQRYNDLGYDVIVVEVPEVVNGEVLSEFVWLNESVAAELGCDLVDWSYRDVMMVEDGIHPTEEGGFFLAYRLALLGKEHICELN